MKSKKILSGILSAALLCTGVWSGFPVHGENSNGPTAELYVSPTGDDTNSGEAGAPFKTLQRARDEVRRQQQTAPGDITVMIAPGTYYLEDTLHLTTEDSGADGYSVTYQGISDESGNSPILSGGVDISDNWELYDSQANIYKRTGVDWEFRQLYTNNDRAIRARVPNLDNPETGGPYFRATGGNGSYPMFIGKNDEYAQKAGDHAEIIWCSSWSQFRARIENYDPSTGIVTFKSPDNTFAWNHHTQGDTPYFLENSLDYLDAEGEWFLDTEEDSLYYKPRAGETMNETQIIAPKLETLVNIEGNSTEDKVQNISFDNLRFLHSNWLAPNSYGYCSVQGGFRYQTEGGKDNGQIRGTARYDSPKSMMQLKYTSGIRLTNSEFSFSGSWGVMGYEGTDNTLIDHNTFRQNAGGGVTMGMAGREWDDMDENETIREYRDMDGQSVHDTITNNLIDLVACDYKDMVGIGAMLPQHMTVANNEISRLPYTGINMGWNWQDTDHGMTNNKVYQNYIHDTCLLLQDGGGIYTLGRMDGDSNFYYNYITNIARSEWAPHDNLMGIYFDNGSCYKKAQANVFDNTVYAFQASNPPNHDNIFEGNYYNCPKGISSIGSSASISNRPFTKDNVPAEAQKIMEHAGIGKAPLPEPTSRVNIAFQKPVTASEADENYPASNATDGDPATRWAQEPIANQPDVSKDPTSLTVDLEGEYAIDEIMVSFQFGNRCRYKLEYSTDNETWHTYADKLDQPASSESSIYESKSGVSARYIRLTMTSEGWGSSVYELYVYSSSADAPATAEISPKTASYDKNPAWKQDIKVTALQNGSAVTGVRNGGYTLVADQDYEKHWGTITLLKSYLDTLAAGEYALIFDFDKSESKTLTLTVSEDDGSSNIALNKPIEASSSSMPASNMVDGDSATRWAQQEGTPNQPATIVIDLQDTYLITKTSIDFELDAAGYNYKIEYSANGDLWRTFVDRMSQDTKTRTVIDQGEAVGRYLRLTVNHKQWGASIWEFQAKGTPHQVEEELVNLALNKPITASTEETTAEYHPASHAVDGNMGTRWAQKMGTPDVHNTLTIDLGSVCNVASTAIHFELGPDMTEGYNYKIEYSTDGEHYETYVDKLNQLTPSKDVTDEKSVQARYFRFEVNNKQWGASIYEIEILGTQPNNIRNLALNNKTITATTEETVAEYHPASHMVDGDMGTRWAQKMGTNGTHNFINIDLGSVCDIVSTTLRFELSPGGDTKGYNYKIQYSENGTDYYDYAGDIAAYTTSQDVTDEKSVKARYFRFEVNHEQWGASIWELEIIGSDGQTSSDAFTEGTYSLADNNGNFLTDGSAAPSLTNEADGGYDEKWIRMYEDNTYFRLVNALSGQALTVNPDNNLGLTAPLAWEDPKQLWSLEKNTIGDDTYMLMNKAYGLMLQINGGEFDGNGGSLGLYYYEGWYKKHFSWTIEDQPDGTVLVKNACGTYLRAASAGANVQTWEKTKGKGQKWNIEKTAGGAYTITNASSGLRIAYDGGVILSAADDSDPKQQWTAEKNSALLTKYVVFTNLASGETLTLNGVSSWKYTQDDTSAAPRPYVTGISVSGEQEMTVTYNYRAAEEEGATEYTVYSLDNASISSGSIIAEGIGKSGFTFDASQSAPDKTILITIVPADKNGKKGAIFYHYILPVKTAENLTGVTAIEESFDGILNTVNSQQKGWYHQDNKGGVAHTVVLDDKDGHPSALGLKAGNWWEESSLGVDFSNPGNDFTPLEGKAYIEYDAYFNTSNFDKDSQAGISLKSGGNIFATIQLRGDQMTLAAANSAGAGTLYPIAEKTANTSYQWMNFKFYVDTQNNKFAAAVNNRFLTGADGSMWFTPSSFDRYHDNGVLNVNKVTGIQLNQWWQSQDTVVYIDNLKTGAYTEGGLDPWTAYAVNAANNDQLLFDAVNQVTVSIKENETVTNGLASVGLFRDGRLYALSQKKEIAFDARGISQPVFDVQVPPIGGDFTLKVFLWNTDMKPVSKVFSKGYRVQSSFQLPNVFSHNMVLQADQPIRVWGHGIPGKTVTASIGENTASATVDSSGDWILELEAMEAGTGKTLTVTCGLETHTYQNVALGDVFILAGQSNMEYWMSGLKDTLADLQANPDRANNPNIRIVELLGLDRNYEATEPRENFPTTGNSWSVMTFDQAWLASQIGYYVAQQLNEETGRPIGLISGAVGGADISRWVTNGDLYNNRIYPCRNMNISAILFYQGESDDSRTAADYSDIFSNLIDDYRALFGREDLPFYYAQIARLSRQHFEAIRSAQVWTLNKVANKKNVGIISTLDEVGNFGSNSDTSGNARYDVHPYGKKEIAARFARYIKHDLYGETETPARGPLYQSMAVKGNTLELTFDCTRDLAVLAKEKYADFQTPNNLDFSVLNEFEIAGADGVYKKATAVISGNKVILSNPQVTEPKNARYAYSAYPEAPNLTDASGLPSYTFCTEHF